jgi:hypothetical protein
VPEESPGLPEPEDEELLSTAAEALSSWLAELADLDLSDWEPFSPPSPEGGK